MHQKVFMGAFRGLIRDIISLYLGIKIFKIWLFGSSFTPEVGWAALALFILAVWFLLERVGIIPKLI